MKSTKTVEITKINNNIREKVKDEIVLEKIINIHVNRKYYASLLCTPNEEIELAIGFLFAEGAISSMKSIKSVEEKGKNIICIILKHELDDIMQRRRVLTSGCVNGSIDLGNLEEDEIEPVKINYKFSADNILKIMKEFNSKSELFKETGGVHSCSISSGEGIIFFSEDIGRHNALDKVLGKSILNEISMEDKMVITTGRISSDIALKAARAGIPLIVSHSAPTEMALSIAQAANVTMAGFVRGNRMSIYCGEDRIII